MSRYNLQKLTPKTRDILFNEYCKAVLKLKSVNEVREFFNDLFSFTEFGMLSRRLLAAKMLIDGYTYEEVNKRFKMGMDTIERINKNLNFGKGYKMVLKRLGKGR
ncbi:MAG: YerC/YecD family TrpR-related protein [Patescibacteria group bacterium]|nr:YerC/YecD family TrpR-related protein [Patescibacteria group bacterium]